jgi:hypothetical protein
VAVRSRFEMRIHDGQAATMNAALPDSIFYRKSARLSELSAMLQGALRRRSHSAGCAPMIAQKAPLPACSGYFRIFCKTNSKSASAVLAFLRSLAPTDTP